LATLGWPASEDEAKKMPRLPLEFVRCLQCGHIYNRLFDYTQVPYVNNPNRMYNRSALWKEHLESVCDAILPYLSEKSVVVEIGCGEAQLLSLLAQKHPQGRYIGFDPHAALVSPHPGVEIRAQLFEPHLHLDELKPDLLLSRHVLEHLMNPLAFIQETAFYCSYFEIFPLLFVEVPCIDRAIESSRLEDFYYEHNSHFSKASFTRFLKQINPNPLFIQTGYAQEVIFGLSRFTPQPTYLEHAESTLNFLKQSTHVQKNIHTLLNALQTQNLQVALWGGTGKGAAFMNSLNLDSTRFPLVIDSDPAKTGTYVPGTGQKIQAKNYLLEHPVDIILITTQWRARDIVNELIEAKIPFQKILIEYQGQLLNYLEDEHPYR